ncbi:hypothetical protein KTO58_09135 [Chitinophaga pendula]|uniref:hypothetical protein n=1 Tax=Chitinophaga TaxID=79328 RepID=UPI000BAF25A0|nr:MULTISPECIES: hypothetical protein [Chitinophaga]ASZ13045.1 hypothetical protein CK934_19810 [Chitinophaga sp. MD30]UCJ09330.1 hypothetical protein KTO58_09135 [Chitinophaga pendula]
MKFLPRVVLASALLASVLSCKKETKIAADQPGQLTVVTARSFFENQVKKISARPESADALPIAGAPNWDSVYTKHLTVGDAIAVPLQGDRYISIGKYKVIPNNYLLIYKGKAGLQHEVVTVIKSPSDSGVGFSGNVIVQDWSGQILQGYSFKNGLYRKTNITVGNRGPQTEIGQLCAEMDIWTCVTVGDFGPYCHYDHTVSACSGGGGGDQPWGHEPGTYPVNPDDYPGSNGGSGTVGNATTNNMIRNLLTEVEKVNDIIQRGKDPNFVDGAKSGLAITQLSIMGIVKYVVTFKWDVNNPQNAQLTEINANLTGLTIGLVDFKQYTATASDLRYNTELRFQIVGEFIYTLFINGVGTLFKIPMTISGTYNTTNGEYMLVQSKLK